MIKFKLSQKGGVKMIFDIHGDIWTDVTVKRNKGIKDVIRNNHLEKFRKGNMAGGIFVIWSDPPHDQRPKDRLTESIRAMSKELAESRDILKVIYNSGDFYRAVEDGKIGILLGLEGLHSIGEDVEALYTLYQLGFRHASLTWNEENPLATGVSGDVNRGLTDLGRKAIKIIEDLGMILDVSHANEKTFWDICDIATKPFIASHSNCKSICDVKRNLTDRQIKAIGEKGGLIGVNAYNGFVHNEPHKRSAEYLANHLDHIVNLIGIDKVGLGFDFFEYLEDDTMDSLNPNGYKGTIDLEDITASKNFIDILRNRGYSDVDIEKISYKNFLNIMDRVLID